MPDQNDPLLPPMQPHIYSPPPFSPMPDQGRARNAIDAFVEIFALVFGWLKQREPIVVLICLQAIFAGLFVWHVVPKIEAEHTEQIKSMLVAFERDRAQSNSMLQMLMMRNGHATAFSSPLVPDNLVLRPVGDPPALPQE